VAVHTPAVLPHASAKNLAGRRNVGDFYSGARDQVSNRYLSVAIRYELTPVSRPFLEFTRQSEAASQSLQQPDGSKKA